LRSAAWRTEGKRYHQDHVTRKSGAHLAVRLEDVSSPTQPVSFGAPFDGDLQADLALALQLADAADAASMARFDAADLDVQLKADATHVTEADLATEHAIRAILASERPGDGVFGEEFGATGSAERSGSSTRSTAPPTTSRASRCGRP